METDQASLRKERRRSPFPQDVATLPLALPPSPSGEHHGAVPPPDHPQEARRLSILRNYGILDSGKDDRFDALLKIAAHLCQTPMALISLVDKERQWFKSSIGITEKELPRNLSFCGHAILHGNDPLIVPDAMLDARFASNPLVTGDPKLRFYAGAPLLSPDGLPIGSFCVLDTRPRTLSEDQITLLRNLSELVINLMEVDLSNELLRNVVELESVVYSRLLLSSTEMACSAQSFDEALSSLISGLDRRLGWRSARIRNMRTGGSTGIIHNPDYPEDLRDIKKAWQKIDSSPSNLNLETSRSELISLSSQSEFSHLVIPIRNRGMLLAIIEFLYPYHSMMDHRVREVFELMASNLGIVAERELVNLELLRQATHDPLTGTANRTLILQTIEQSLENVDPLDPDTALFYIDVDGFKEVNDDYGHQVGDQLLVRISERLAGICRRDDLIGRLSGDEFIVLAHHPHLKEGLPGFLNRLHTSLNEPFVVGDVEIVVTSSVGCVILEDPHLSISELMSRAETAMYLAKSRVRKGVSIADQEVLNLLSRRRHLDHNVKEGIQKKRLLLYFQPIFDLRSGRLHGAESLVRMLQRDGSLLNAGDFIGAVERIKYLPILDEWVLNEAIGFLALNAADLLAATSGFRLTVNVTPAVLSSKDFATNCLGKLAAGKVNPSMLTLEVVENDLLTVNETVLANIAALREAGTNIAVDDFGTGYSNLVNLSNLPIDLIKIDQSFLKGKALHDGLKNELLSAIVSLATNLGYPALMEGVETQAQADHVKELGCRYAQGFLYARPMAAPDFLHYLQTLVPLTA